jgi:hypothetical protein
MNNGEEKKFQMVKGFLSVPVSNKCVSNCKYEV